MLEEQNPEPPAPVIQEPLVPQSTLFTQLKHRGMPYWIRFAVFLALGAVIGLQTGKFEPWRKYRFRLYQLLQESMGRQAYARETTVVLIGDDEYWRGELAHRAPLKRDYLAKLILAVNRYDPAVIALDVNLRYEA